MERLVVDRLLARLGQVVREAVPVLTVGQRPLRRPSRHGSGPPRPNLTPEGSSVRSVSLEWGVEEPKG